MLFVGLAEAFVRWVFYAALVAVLFWTVLLVRAWYETKVARSGGPSLKELEDGAWAKGPEHYEDWCIARGIVPTRVWKRTNGLPTQRRPLGRVTRINV